VAAALGIPAVRHVWGVDYTYLGREFEDEALSGLCARLGVAGVEPLGEVTVDPCPPSLQVAPTPRVPQPVVRLPMRYIAYNNRAVLPSVVRAPGERPRVLVTWGGSSSKWDPRLDIGSRVALALADLDVEVVYATAGEPSPRLAGRPTVTVERNVALNLLLPGCDLMVAHGGLGTMLTGVVAGVPQLTLPQIADQVLNARQLTATGAGDFAYAVDLDDDGLRARVATMLADPTYGAAAAKLRDEAAGLDGPAEIVTALAARYGGTR
jgi:UDP:flavonoid glycosyltransferase YjiC (YdhE family)